MDLGPASAGALHAALREAARAGPTFVDEHGAVHVLRHDEATIHVARYVLENPVRAGLVSPIDDYPYVGSMTMSVRELLDSVSDGR